MESGRLGGRVNWTEGEREENGHKIKQMAKSLRKVTSH